ncbi:protoporphyrinogen oxidase [Phanerochaete sordida]|uniref:Protoporphyrinogen oxidase n=1 Tax=Phanerochaete sordida TaxID=48140 RepID=A0A9P3FXS9_9APHY|nr:protoporphyrinogen oxidase [Phanerochaete sordida]
MSAPTRISVIGGGLSGLSSAFHLARRFPAAKITLLEQSPRLGGWVDNERVHVKDDKGNEARMLLERGPRTLRPNGKAVLELINLLNLQQALLIVPKTAAAARTRFLHIPGTRGLTALPSSLASLFATPLGRAIAWAGAREPLRGYPDAPLLAAEDGDESLHDFLSARLGPELARILGSALVHGIYAADSKLLSVRAAFPSLWDLAKDGRGSIVRGMLSGMSKRRASGSETSDYDLGGVPSIMKAASVYSFKSGMAVLPNALRQALLGQQNVEIVNDRVDAIQRAAHGDVTIQMRSGIAISASHIVSAIPLPALHTLIERSSLPSLPHLLANPTSSVTVVNLVFPPTAPGQPIHPDGFGYLIPRDKDWNASVLGTVFDSCSLSAQDEYPSADAPRFTKLTMMIRAEPSSAPVTQASVLAHLTQHLAPPHPLPAPVYFAANTMRGCIPTPTVGHVQRMKELRDAARREWGGRLELVGAGVGGVSVGDCIEQGRRVGRTWAS